jgi:hypothetical protein
MGISPGVRVGGEVHRTSAPRIVARIVPANNGRQGTQGYELRAAASPARLRRHHGRHAVAGDLLRPVYVWFTEGVDTSDLKRGKGVDRRARLIMRNCASSLDEFRHNRTSRRDDITRRFVKHQSRYIKRAPTHGCCQVYVGHFRPADC